MGTVTLQDGETRLCLVDDLKVFTIIFSHSRQDKEQAQDLKLMITTSNHKYSTLNTPIPDDGDDATVEQIKKRNKWENDDYVCRGIILNVICALRSLSRCRIVTSQSNNVVGPSVVNMIEHNNSIRYNDNKGKHKHQDIKADPSKKSKVTCWKCEKPRYLKKYCKDGKIGNKVYYVTYVSESYFVEDDDVARWGKRLANSLNQDGTLLRKKMETCELVAKASIEWSKIISEASCEEMEGIGG
ncbi:hypothetical protein Tco_0038394 [Tanacetum coccineum]